MPLVDINWQPKDRQLRQFGVVCLLVLPLAGWLWGGGRQGIGVLAAVGLALAVTGWIAPRVLKPVFVLLSAVGAPLGIIVSELAMLTIYFGVLLPIGFCFRLLRRDALKSKRDPDAATYWQAKKQPRGAASYYRQS